MAVAVPPEMAAGVPPHNDEAEASVLGAILLTEQALDGVLLEVGLRPHDFYRPRHEAIFQAMIRLKEKADARGGRRAHGGRGAAPQRRAREGGRRGLPPLAADGGARGRARSSTTRGSSRSTRCSGACSKATREIQDDVAAHRGDARELIERAESVLFKIGHDGGTSEMRSLEAILHDEIDKLEELSKTDVGLTGTPSGFTDLDALTGGFQPGNLIVLAARPVDGQERAPPRTSPSTPPSRPACRWRCSRSRCPRPSSRTASSPPRRACRATTCGRAACAPRSGRRCSRRWRSSRARRSTWTTRAT